MASLLKLSYRYVAQRRARGEINDRTAEQLESRLRSFALLCDDVRSERVRRRHVERWLEVPDLSPAYRRSRFSALKGFCSWCVQNGHMPKDPTLGIKVPSVPQGLPRARPREDVAKILAHCPDLRTKVCALLMIQEGLRRAEVANAQVADLCLRAQTLAVRGKGGRGQVTRVVPVSDETARVIRAYWNEIGMAAGPLIRSVKWPDRGVKPQRIGELVTAAMWDAGVKQANGDGCSSHALRHSAAHDLIESGATVLEVQEFLGHRSISNTMIYLRGHVSPDLRRAAGGRSYLTA